MGFFNTTTSTNGTTNIPTTASPTEMNPIIATFEVTPNESFDFDVSAYTRRVLRAGGYTEDDIAEFSTTTDPEEYQDELGLSVTMTDISGAVPSDEAPAILTILLYIDTNDGRYVFYQVEIDIVESAESSSGDGMTTRSAPLDEH